jgi:AAA ATPase-like protein
MRRAGLSWLSLGESTAARTRVFPCPEYWSYCGRTAASRTPAFRGRSRERQALDRLLDSVRNGESAVLVIRGEAGIGKTALLHYCARQAAGCRVAKLAGVESELAALHQLCAPMLDDLATLPEPQQHAMRMAFGLAAGSARDRFVVDHHRRSPGDGAVERPAARQGAI